LEGRGLHIAQWAGLAIFEADSYEKIFAVFKDEDYLKIVVPDELKFIDRDNCQMLPLDLGTILDK
jgi:EthD domain